MTLEDRLAALAAAGQTITYGELAREFGLRMAELTARLETLMEEDAAAGRPFRAALLRQRLSPDHLPAPGFFLKAAALGRPTDDPAGFVRSQRQALLPFPNIPG
ncbi:MAG: hypothetical protein ACK4IU_16405 [Tabrizicola flagellatus]|uniref:hypothetical protein n=1 Tax=Tabrizicola flagellatus TaxID=2593021 RepID=UPI00391DADE0